MSVKGFRFNDVVHKYDYDSLDNIPTPDKTLTKDGEAADSKTVGDAITTLHHLVGTPLVANSAASMTDKTKIYVYTGSETGYVNGHWYYFDGTLWADGGVYNSTALETDKTLTVENAAADAKKTGDSLDDLKSAISEQPLTVRCIKGEYIVSGNLVPFNKSASPSNSSIACTKLLPCIPGEKVRVVMPDIDGITYTLKYRYGWYKANGEWIDQQLSTDSNTFTIPNNAYYFLFGVTWSDGSGSLITDPTLYNAIGDSVVRFQYLDRPSSKYKEDIEVLQSEVEELNEVANNINNEFDAQIINYNSDIYAVISFSGTGDNHYDYNVDAANVDIKEGERFSISFNLSSYPINFQFWYVNSDGSAAKLADVSDTKTLYFTAASNIVKIGVRIGVTLAVGNDFRAVIIKEGSPFGHLQSESNQLIEFPLISNGSGGNAGNANAVTARAIRLNTDSDIVYVRNKKPLKNSGNYYRYSISAFIGTTFAGDAISLVAGDANEEISFSPQQVIAVASGVDAFGITVWEYDSSGNNVSNRYTDFYDYPLIVRYGFDSTEKHASNETAQAELKNAEKTVDNSGTALTLLHFSDIHADANALKRIVGEKKKYFKTVSDIICTGDITGHTYGEITSWWDPSVLTCIGNHDTASYSDGAYNWTALSMENRDAYYIAPFEANWGITHTSGTSYYYKDYSTQKVRLIVMDVMLYNDNGAEASAQTAWLANLLSDAITNNLHVLIAIHAPHGGAPAVDCSFSKYGATTMPVYTDCNTPQAVIDAVAEKIIAGLHFIGYICGHTHQDYIWDAENDGKQLMYCVTCGSTVTAQTKNSDLFRSTEFDAYNLITIDTTNNLVKIIRGGGANVDIRMRNRKAICFDYATGQKVGEVL